MLHKMQIYILFFIDYYLVLGTFINIKRLSLMWTPYLAEFKSVLFIKTFANMSH